MFTVRSNHILMASLTLGVATAGAATAAPGIHSMGVPAAWANHSRPPSNRLCWSPGRTPVYIIASDNVTGNVYIYCEDMPPMPTTPHLIYPGAGGWGVAVSPDRLLPGNPVNLEAVALGVSGTSTTPGSVTVHSMARDGSLSPTISTLQLTNPGANALGLCFDGTGGLYATEYPTTQVDYFTNAQVVGPYTGPPSNTWQMSANIPSDPFYGYYLACDYDELITSGSPPPRWENYVMVDGTDANGNIYVGSLTAGGPVTGAVTAGPSIGSAPTNYPAGMAINKKDFLVMNLYPDVLLDYGNREPWKSPISSCTYDPAYAFVPIAFDNGQAEIWAGNDPAGSANAVSVQFKFGSSCVSPGESGGPTTVLQNALFKGIAVYPNAGV